MATTKTTIPTPVTDASVTPAIEAPAVSAAPTNTMSVVAVVSGILSFVVAQPVLAIVAIVLGILARRREPAAITTANWAIVLGVVSLFGGFIIAMLGIAAVLPFAFSSAFWAW